MRALVAALAALLLVAVPIVATATPPDIWRSPFIPTDLGDPRDGTVVLTLSVWTGTAWAADTTVVHPAGLSVDCGAMLPPEGA